MNKNKTAILAVIGIFLASGFIFANFSGTNTTIAFDGPPNSAGVGSGTFAVNATGSVAIATSTFSSSKLRVAGSIQSTTGGFIFPDGSTQTTAAGSVTSTPAGYVTPGIFNSVAGTGGNYTFPASIVLGSTTDSSAGSGIIYKNTQPFIHDFFNELNDGGNTFVGLNSGNFTMGGGISGFSGSYNSAFGFGAMNDNTFGDSNTAAGYLSLASNTIGNDNSALGKNSLTDNTSGNNNSAVGSEALSNNVEGINNTAMGAFALLTNINGSDNAAVGMASLYFNVADENSAVGSGSLYSNTFGVRNVALGRGALSDNTTGNGNTAIGAHAADNTAVGLLTMSSTTFLGARANSSVDGITNSTAIGANAQVARSNQVVIGNLSVTETLLNGSVGLGTTTAPVARLAMNMDSLAGNPLAFSMKDATSQWYFTIPRCASCYVPGSAIGDLVLRGTNSRSLIVSVDNGSSPGFSIASGGRVGIGTSTPIESLSVIGHIGTYGSPAPTVQSCGTSPSITGTDTAGKIQVGTGTVTACTLKFGTYYVNPPSCVFTSVSTTARDIGITKEGMFAVTTTIAANLGSGKINYHCFAQ
jgi:hypothetical protein